MRLNLSQHSLPSEKLALSHESPDTLDTIKANLRAEHQPVNQTEEILVNEMAEQFWRLRRARVIETSLLDSDKVLIPHLAAIQRMMSSAERGFHKALTALRQLQKDRGFVPQKNRDCQGPAKLTATEPRPKEAVAPGFVPPPCPADEEVDPADWARAFAARQRVHARLATPVE
jgi:hypothetical protein